MTRSAKATRPRRKGVRRAIILPTLTVLIHTAVMTLQLLASNMEGHGTALIANMVHPVLTVRPVRLHTAVMITQLLVLKPAEHGTARIAKCLKVQALQFLLFQRRLQQSQLRSLCGLFSSWRDMGRDCLPDAQFGQFQQCYSKSSRSRLAVWENNKFFSR